MDKNIYTNLETRTFYIGGDIAIEDIGYLCFNLLHLLEEDRYTAETLIGYEAEPINIYITSMGGDIRPMWGLIDIMLSSETPIHTYCVGAAFSAALQIFLAGSKRFAYKHSTFMYHQVLGGTVGNFTEMCDYVNEVNTIQYEVEQYVKERTSLPQEKMDEVRNTKKDWYFSADEAYKYGVVTDLI